MKNIQRIASLSLFLVILFIVNSCSNTPRIPEDLLIQLPYDQLIIPSNDRNMLTIGNDSNSVVSWEVSTSTPWLSLEPQSGTILPDGFSTITVEAGTATSGERGIINLISDLGDYPVTVEIASASCIDPSTAPDNEQPTPAPTRHNQAYVPNQLIIRYEEGYSSAEQIMPQAIQVYGLQTLQEPTETRPALVEIQNMDVLNQQERTSTDLPALEQLAAELSALPHIRYAEPNHYLYPQRLGVEQITSDPFYERQWYLKDYGLEEAWRLSTGNAAVTVAVLDSSMDVEHEDLEGRFLKGCDIYDKDDDVNPNALPITAASSHGTHVSGIIGAVGGNAKGVVGVVPEGVRILPVKVFNDAGFATSVLAVTDAIRWAAGLDVAGLHRNPYPVDIINLSLGGIGINETLNEAVEDARRQGVLVIAASGNDGFDDQLRTPSNAPYALAVGSIDGTQGRSCFSNYDGDKYERSVEIVAPGGASQGFVGRCTRDNAVGELIFNTFPMDLPYLGYGEAAGTSMATPFVSGVAALILSQNPFLSADAVKARLLQSTLKDIPNYNRAEYGAGILCADRAVGASTLCGRTVDVPEN